MPKSQPEIGEMCLPIWASHVTPLLFISDIYQMNEIDQAFSNPATIILFLSYSVCLYGCPGHRMEQMS